MAGKGSHKDCDRKGKNGLKPEPGAPCCSGLGNDKESIKDAEEEPGEGARGRRLPGRGCGQHVACCCQGRRPDRWVWQHGSRGGPGPRSPQS